MKPRLALCKHCGRPVERNVRGEWWYHVLPPYYQCGTIDATAEPFFWDGWIGHSNNGPVVMWIKSLVKVLGRRIDLHLMMPIADMAECFHTHPALAFRLVLWGGYWEELESGMLKAWRPGSFGFVRPDFSHRIHSFMNPKGSLSLWIRGRVTHEIQLRGKGWNHATSSV